MLAVARSKVPSARFEVGDLESLPFDEDEFDLAIVSLALCHLSDPAPAIAELARVVRIGGTVIITDPHPTGGLLGGQAFYGAIATGQPMKWVRNHHHSASVWLRSFRHAGLAVVDCIEAPFSDEQVAATPSAVLDLDATMAALTGLPSLWVWELTVER